MTISSYSIPEGRTKAPGRVAKRGGAEPRHQPEARRLLRKKRRVLEEVAGTGDAAPRRLRGTFPPLAISVDWLGSVGFLASVHLSAASWT
jgi:hypothetical protein